MTDEQIDALTEGSEIDELVARRVMGWDTSQYQLFQPSSDIIDTKCVWEELIRRGLEVNMSYEKEWIVSIVSGKFGLKGAHAPTIELAMTKATLKAVGKET